MRRALVIVALAAAGCGSSRDNPRAQPTPNIVQPGAPGEPSRRLSPEEAAKVESVKPTEADVRFMQDMVHHHSQAVEMTRWVPSRAVGRDVKLIAKRMRLTQEGEIEVMESWLERNGVEPVRHHAETMPGMLTGAQMARLEAADGRRFDRLFLRYMTQHHRGALQMVGELRRAGGGMPPGIDQLARDIEADQQIEILRMRDLLANL